MLDFLALNCTTSLLYQSGDVNKTANHATSGLLEVANFFHVLSAVLDQHFVPPRMKLEESDCAMSPDVGQFKRSLCTTSIYICWTMHSFIYCKFWIRFVWWFHFRRSPDRRRWFYHEGVVKCNIKGRKCFKIFTAPKTHVCVLLYLGIWSCFAWKVRFWVQI